MVGKVLEVVTREPQTQAVAEAVVALDLLAALAVLVLLFSHTK